MRCLLITRVEPRFSPAPYFKRWASQLFSNKYRSHMNLNRIFSFLLLFTYFSQVIAAENQLRQITDKNLINNFTKQFEEGVSTLGIHAALNCSKIIEVNGSIGAFCSLPIKSGSRTIMLCDDMMVGKLTIKAYGFGETDETIVEFTKKNCPPGG